MGARLYTVHYREETGRSPTGLGEDAILVKLGFSWPAFLIPLIWLVYKRMWIVLAAFVAVEVAIAAVAVGGWLPDDAITILSIGVQLVLGFEGNDLYRWTLARRRYRERAVVAAENLEMAERRFFSDVAGRVLP